MKKGLLTHNSTPLHPVRGLATAIALQQKLLPQVRSAQR